MASSNKNKTIWNLTESQQVAFCKFVKKVAYADGVVSAVEISKLPKIHESYFVQSNKITLQDAANELKCTGRDIKLKIISALEAVAKADGHVAKAEIEVIKEIQQLLDI